MAQVEDTAWHQPGRSLTSLPAVAPSLKVLDGLGLDDFHVFPKACNVQSSLEHFFLLQKDLVWGKKKFKMEVWVIFLLWTCSDEGDTRGTHRVGDVVSDSFSKHRRGEPGVDVLCIQVIVLAVEHERSCVTAQEVGEGAASHGETEHWPVLRGAQGLKDQRNSYLEGMQVHNSV